MAPMRGSRGFAGAILAALLWSGSASPDRDVKPRAALLDGEAAFGRSDVPLPGRDAVLALADPLSLPDRLDPDVKLDSRNTSDDCHLAGDCIDQYLFSMYQRAKKLDTIKVPERISVTVKKKVKKRTVTKTVTKTITKLVDEDFTWKDPQAAEKTGMTLAEYVIGGMDRGFKLRLYRLLRALDDAGFAPGITSAFRDDYRQSIASGLKAANNRSYHGGSLRAGYGHGLAADLVSVKGETRSERAKSSEELWKWIDAQGRQFGIGRPYLDKDPPHVAPIDGKEYADHRGSKRAALEK